MFKQIADLTRLASKAKEMTGQMSEIQAQLREKRATGTAGAGMVEVEVNGVGEVLRVSIEPALVEKGDREMIEDLLPGAINQALAKSKQMNADAMASLTEGFDIPGLSDTISKMTGQEQ